MDEFIISLEGDSESEVTSSSEVIHSVQSIECEGGETTHCCTGTHCCIQR